MYVYMEENMGSEQGGDIARSSTKDYSRCRSRTSTFRCTHEPIT